MFSTMTTKLIFNLFIVLTICSYAFAQVGNSCTVKSNGVRGICKISSDCPIVEEQAKNGVSPTICGFYQLTVPIVCCEIENFNLQPNDNSFLNSEPNNPDAVIYPENEPAPSNTQQLSRSEQKCKEYSRLVTGTVQAIPLVTNTEAVTINTVKCDNNGVALIVGGKPAFAGEFPFMAAIGFNVDNKIEWRCGGTLISNEYVLTAAHCTFSRDADAPEKVRLGDLDLIRTDDGSVHVDYNIKRLIVHPNYHYPHKYNDIALIQLSRQVKFTKFIRPACLYTKSKIAQEKAVATGWGKTDYAASETSSKLMKVSLNIYNNDQCSQTYPPNKYLPQGIKSNMLCAGELLGGMDTCQGDSGGPLLVTKQGNQCEFYVIGITSFGKFCGQENTPAVYTKVSTFVTWIEETVWH